MPESFFNNVAGLACNFIKKETLAQVFFFEFFKISKNSIFHRPYLVAVSVTTKATKIMVELMIKVTAVMVNMIIKERMKIAVYDLGVLGYFAPKILYKKN